MFNWAKQTLANVAGTQEPEYGPSAIRSVAEEAATQSYTELTRDDLKWQDLDITNVETQTFYFFTDSGRIASAQVIYNNLAGLRITAQFNFKIWSTDPAKPHLWSSTPLNNPGFSEDRTAFYADDCAVELSEDGTFYTIKSLVDQKAVVNIKVSRTAPGFHAGKTGKTLYGTDLNNPWGSMRHAFWPRAVVEGTVTTEEGPFDIKGRAMYSYALQGMKPHHAAARWNFANFQGPTYSAMMMEFTTPASYGSTLVNIGGIVKDGEIVSVSCGNKAIHTSTKQDSENDWPEPSGLRFEWAGKTKDDKSVEGALETALDGRIDKVDVMAEVPGFVKNIVAAAAGTKPYIYQYAPKATLKLKIGDEEVTEEGQLFSEATFIS